ncbi:MAG: ATP-binding protein [Candidatus Marinimicrobia bacterium]|nr:ATP-binding protein [Candidatus Neomarinimicrobiota bacterium]
MKKRLLFNKLKNHLKKKQISLIVGARQTGKTTLMQQLMKELKKDRNQVFFLTLEDPNILKILNEHPAKLFLVIPPIDRTRQTIIFIDEIQYLDFPSNFLKYHYDKYHEKIKFIVSGSSSFYIDKKFTDSLAGRKRLFKLPTLSFEEMLIFRDRTELTPFINKKIPPIFRDEIYTLLQEYIIFGGYPEVILEPDIEEKKHILAEIANSYVKKDALESNLKYPNAYLTILQIYAERVGGIVSYNNIASDFSMNHLTINAYTELMQKSFHISLIKPFYRKLSKELRKSPKVYFNDLGLRNHFLHNFNALFFREDRGNLFENYIFRRLLDKYDEMDIKYWRTQNKHEVDFIIQNQKAYETKFSQEQFYPYKYHYFADKYPDIPLNLIHYENALETDL